MRCNEYQYKHRILRYSNSTFVSPLKTCFSPKISDARCFSGAGGPRGRRCTSPSSSTCASSRPVIRWICQRCQNTRCWNLARRWPGRSLPKKAYVVPRRVCALMILMRGREVEDENRTEERATWRWTDVRGDKIYYRLDSVGLVWLGSLVQKPQGPTRHLLCRDFRTTLSWPGNGIIPPVFPRKPGWKVACQSLCVLLRRRRFKTCFKSLKALRACSLANIDWRWLNICKAHWMANLMWDEGFSWNFRIFLPLQLFFAKFSQLWGLEMMDLPPQKCEA